MGLPARLVRSQLNFFKPFVANCSLELLKQDGVMHGCVCLEAGVLLDFFTPMRDEFV